MQKLQRKAGQLLKRTADDAEVALLMKEFDEGDNMLKIIIEATKQFRVSWTELVQTASGMATDFDEIYQFIPSADPEDNAKYLPTSKEQLAKVEAYKEAMTELRNLMIQELASVERSVGMPAKDARKHIDVYRKFLKKREDRKLDWERYKSRTDSIERNSTKSERDARALMKHTIDLEVSEKAYHDADGQIKSSLPELTRAIYTLLPRLVNAHCMISNTMFGHYYTALHDYCQQYGYPIPSSEWRQVQSEGEEAFVPVRRHIESISMIQKGRAVKQPFHSRPDSLQTKTVSHRTPSGLTKNGALPPPVPGQQQSSPTLDFSSKPTRTTSNTSYTSYNRPSPPASTASFHTANASEYFSPTSGGANRQGSQPPTPYLGTVSRTVSKTPSSASLASAAAAIAVKKKPPPPPPKRKPSTPQYDYVIAQYNFDGEGAGDLPFREGDKIKVIKRTESDNDWWEGECRGRQGSFPANYCKAM